jgi:hypothetical protein
MSRSLAKIDVMDLISLICLFREETYVFERHLALLTFGLWVIEPNDPLFVNHGRLVGAARIVKSVMHNNGKIAPSAKRKFFEKAFATNVVASALLSPPVIGPFNDEIEPRKFDLELGRSVVETFLRAPSSRLRTKRPSLNKAIYFIANEGFGPHYKFAPATIKKQWVSHAVTAPFLLAEENVTFDLIGLAPDAPNWLKLTDSILKRTAQVREYFGLAKSIQETFVSKLDPVSRKRFQFVEFPSQVEAVVIDYEPFSVNELKIYQSYSAPKY